MGGGGGYGSRSDCLLLPYLGSSRQEPKVDERH